jgi:hypothetical protein
MTTEMTTAAIDKLKTDMDELSERELDKASGGFGKIKWTYTQQKRADGTGDGSAPLP